MWPGTLIAPTHGFAPVTRRLSVTWVVSVIGRVCGTAIGMLDMPTVSRTSSRSTNPRHGRTAFPVVRFGPGQQQERRSGFVAQPVQDEPLGATEL